MNARYEEYLNSDTWKALKKKVVVRALFVCEGCGQDGLALDVHHLTYDRIGMELMTDLVALCKSCHSKIHGKADNSDWHNYLSGNPKKPLELTLEKMSKKDRLAALVESV